MGRGENISVAAGILILCLASPLVRSMEQESALYWVVGSFKSYSQALRGGEEVRAAIDWVPGYMPVTVSGQQYFRLLIQYPADPDVRSQILQRLTMAGASDPWPVRLQTSTVLALGDIPETAITTIASGSMLEKLQPAVTSQQPELSVADELVDAAGQEPYDFSMLDYSSDYALVGGLEDYFLVLGSYKDRPSAQLLADRIMSQQGQITEIRSFTIDGSEVVRVMAGPYLDQAAALTGKVEFGRAGYQDAWLLKGPSLSQSLGDPLTDLDYDSILQGQVLQGQVQRAKLPLRRKIEQPPNTIAPGYNLARLKRK